MAVFLPISVPWHHGPPRYLALLHRDRSAEGYRQSRPISTLSPSLAYLIRIASSRPSFGFPYFARFVCFASSVHSGTIVHFYCTCQPSSARMQMLTHPGRSKSCTSPFGVRRTRFSLSDSSYSWWLLSSVPSCTFCLSLPVYAGLYIASSYFIERGTWDDTLGTFINSDGDPSQFAVSLRCPPALHIMPNLHTCASLFLPQRGK
jgi:hypothetical protein